MRRRKLEPRDVLLIEDNPLDIIMTKRALEEGDFSVRLHVVQDGEEGMSFLRRTCEADATDSFCPDLILLDLNLPKKNGREVLSEIRDDPVISHIPVIILTTSAEEKDISECYSRLANCYITKPMGLDNFKKAIKKIGEFWTDLAELPKNSNELPGLSATSH